MVGAKSPMSPVAMRQMAIKLIERASEIEREEVKEANEGCALAQLPPAIGALWDSPTPPPNYPFDTLAILAKVIHKQRQRRDVLLGIPVTQEPAWDMLLDLYIARTEGKPISTSSAYIASNAPPTTALRYISLLEAAGMICRIADPFDNRVTYVEITPSAYLKVAEYLFTVRLELTRLVVGSKAGHALTE